MILSVQSGPCSGRARYPAPRRGVLSPALGLGEDSGETLHELSGVIDKKKLKGGEKGTPF